MVYNCLSFCFQFAILYLKCIPCRLYVTGSCGFFCLFVYPIGQTLPFNWNAGYLNLAIDVVGFDFPFCFPAHTPPTPLLRLFCNFLSLVLLSDLSMLYSTQKLISFSRTPVLLGNYNDKPKKP